jgi:maltose alpha-D-glucosyltransferase/alpha-amylase
MVAVEPEAGGRKIRIHGDYHLGQVLRRGDRFVILDFEGEPTRPLADRRAKQSPLRDVAGMLRSFDYAVSSVLLERAERDADKDRAETWRSWASWAFLRSYVEAIAPASVLPVDPASTRGMLTMFLLEKLCFEVGYELNFRPEWTRIPLGALADLLGERG